MKQFHIAVILPHCKLFGGVRRFFELGEIFIREGHTMTIFTPDGVPPDWFSFSGKVEKLVHLNLHVLTLLFTTEPVFLENMIAANSRLKVFYHVGPGADLKEVLKHPDIFIFSNSSNMYLHDKKKYGISTFQAIGGVHIPEEPKTIIAEQDPFIIMCYGRLARKGKGTHIVVKAAEKMYKKGFPVKLLLFDTPLDEKGRTQIQQFKPRVPFEFILDHPVDDNVNLFKRSNVFVAVERKGGWSNTAAEAMAAGVPVIGGKTGTKDFLINNITGLKVIRHWFFLKRALQKMILDVSLQRELADNGREKIKTFSWEELAKKILHFTQAKLVSGDKN